MQNLDVEPNKETVHNENPEDTDWEWPSNNTIDLYAIASAAGHLAGDLNSKPGALNDFFDKLKTLEHEWYSAEKRYHKLKIENDRLNNQLIHERTRCAIYQKKLKFIQDNQKNFEKLKQVYVTMKSQESIGKSSKDFQETASQTINLTPNMSIPTMGSSGFIRKCDKAVLTKYFGSVIQSDSMVSIKRSELSDAQDNLQLLKNMIRKREYAWSMNIQREDALKEEIVTLQHDKHALEALLHVKDLELKALKNLNTPNEQEENINNMKRIIGKMSKRLKELEKIGKIGKMNLFNEKEKMVVQDIEERDAPPRRPQMQKPQPAKITTNRSFPGSTGVKPTVRGIKTNMSVINENKMKAVSDSSEEYDKEIQELELLGQIKKSIEAKQIALKEKVQQIIDYSEHRGDRPCENRI